MAKNLYYIEHTDTFGGEANYSWVRRYIVQATTKAGAMRRVATGWRKDYEGRYNSTSGCTCWFVECVDSEEAEAIEGMYSTVERI